MRKSLKFSSIIVALFCLQLFYVNCSEFQGADGSSPQQSSNSVIVSDNTSEGNEPEPATSYDPFFDPLKMKEEPSQQQEVLPLPSQAEPVEALSINSVNTKNITTSSAQIFWSLSHLAQGYVEYGPTPELGFETKGEMRFLYSSHQQPLSDLLANTTYYYRVHSRNEDGEQVMSQLYNFKTQSEPIEPVPEKIVERTVASKGWPAKIDNNLPLAGIFYGNHVHGWRTGNAKTGVENIRRFRAQRTGKIKAIKYNNRTLSNSTVKLRCNGDPKNVWCKCVNAGLDAGECGYTLSNSYSVGNGGTIVIEVRADNGKGLPSEVLLGKTAPFSPVANQKKEYPSLPLLKPVSLTAGVIYHLVYTNLTPPSCRTYGLSAEAARKCPKNEGASGLNGIAHISRSSTTGRYGPYGGDADLNLYRMSVGGEWKADTDVLSFYELQYEDGEWRGDSYHAYDSTIADGWKAIQGQHIARQIFKVEKSNRKVNGLWLNFGHLATADGSSLNVTLKDERGNTLATGSIQSSQQCLSLKKDYCRDWGYTDFEKMIDLKKGLTYSVELSASSKAGYIISTYNPMTIQGFNASNLWRNSKAQYSSNRGTTWGNYAKRLPNERDMALLFTIEGMPKKL